MHKTGQRIKRQPNAAVSGKTCAGSFSGRKYRKENRNKKTVGVLYIGENIFAIEKGWD